MLTQNELVLETILLDAHMLSSQPKKYTNKNRLHKDDATYKNRMSDSNKKCLGKDDDHETQVSTIG